MIAQVTVNPIELRGMLTDLERTAAGKTDAPFHRVCLFSDGDILVGLSSDRYILAQAHIAGEVTSALPEVTLDLDQIKVIQLGLKNIKVREAEKLTLICDTEAQVVVGMHGSTPLFKAALNPETYVATEEPWNKGERNHGTDVDDYLGNTYAEERFATVAAVAKRRKQRVQFRQPGIGNRPTQIVIGGNYRAMLMALDPDKATEEQKPAQPAPVFDRPGPPPKEDV